MLRVLMVFVVVLLNCLIGHAEEPAASVNPEAESSLKALVERLESRIDELEAEVQQLKYAQQRDVIGGSLLESIDPSRPQQDNGCYFNEWGPLADRAGMRNVDRAGVIRDLGGRRIGVGYWGIDFNPGAIRQATESKPEILYLPFPILR